MDYFVIRLKRNDDLKKSITKFAKENNIYAGVIVSAVGSVSEVRIRKADGVNEYFELRDHEILSLSGTISKDGVHLHISLSNDNMRVIGGHLLDGTIVNTTCELVIMKFNKYSLSREFDEETGYNELVVVENEKK